MKIEGFRVRVLIETVREEERFMMFWMKNE
jgi:hypothetical protein